MMRDLLRRTYRSGIPTAHLLGALIAGWLSVSPATAWAEDWPTYAHDSSRSNVTRERLAFPLEKRWEYRPRFAPAPAWGIPPIKPTEGILELPRVHFDDAPQVVIAQGLLYFGSSADNTVSCWDAVSGTPRWTYTTGGPVRLAPTVVDGRVYFGSDEGYAYCLKATDGALVWRFHAAPTEQRVLGHGRMISLWPLRTGVLVDNGVAYLGAGVFPAEGVFLFALDACTGKELWRNDSGGETPHSRISPQGYLLATQEHLFVPMGRTSPAAFDRTDGKLLANGFFGKTVGGTYALVADDAVYTGTEELVAYRTSGKALDRFAMFDGRKLIITAEIAYVATGSRLMAIDRKSYPETSRKLHTARLKRQAAVDAAGDIRRDRTTLEREIAEAQADRQTAPDRAALDREIQAKQARVAALEASAAKGQADLTHWTAESTRLQAELATAYRWNVPCEADQALILSGDKLIVGGNGKVEALNATDGAVRWSYAIEGQAKGLAVAQGRLYVSTDRGGVHCFGPVERLMSSRGALFSPTEAPHESTPQATEAQQAAAEILRQSGVRRGYCLVLGCETGRLAVELARQSDLMIYAVAADQTKLAAARRTVQAANLYGGRVCVDQFPLDQVPYADYFANLIVSETTLTTGVLPPAAEAARMLKPCGGVMLLEQSATKPKLTADACRKWLAATGLPDGQLTGHGLRLVRGALPGAGNWTHEYGNAGNTACGDDELVKAPLGVLWFGHPGPERMISRHQRAPAPLVIDGRMITIGENWLMAYDAYNGQKLWERNLPGVIRRLVSQTGSNLAANHQGVFVVQGDACLHLDPATGRTLHTYKTPAATPGKKGPDWAYLSCDEQAVYGSTLGTGKGYLSDAVFSYAFGQAQPRWVFTSGKIPLNTLAVDGKRLLLVDEQLDAREKEAALARRQSNLAKASTDGKTPPRPGRQKAAIRRLAALDTQTGQLLWQRAIDLTGCDTNPAIMVQGDVLITFGVFTDGHYWKQFFAGDYAYRRVTAYATADGRELWSQPMGYRVRPVIIGNTLHAEPWAFDLHSGAAKTRVNPITGQTEIWQFARPGHHCGCPNAAPHCLFFRSLTLGYYDLDGDFGTMHFGAQRPGCWINFVPAAGLLVMPEASAGCMCPFPNVCSVVFQPRKETKGFAYYSATGAATPVRRLALNMGAAGDRNDEQGQLWLGIPRPTGSLVMPLKVDVEFAAGGGFTARSSAYYTAQPTWLFASAVRSVIRCTIPLLNPGDGRCRYDVRLAFCDPDNDQPGRRVFDVQFQGRTVLSKCDIARETGGRDRPLWKEITGLEIDDKLVIDFVPKCKQSGLETTPLLQGVEIVRRAVLTLGCQIPDVTISALALSATQTLQVVNLREQAFSGTLRLGAVPGLKIAPLETRLQIAPGSRQPIELSVTAASTTPAGVYAIPVRLVRADGTLELEKTARVEHLGRRGRIVIPVAEDACIRKRYPEQNKGAATDLMVDGGAQKMNDLDHALVLLKFRLKIPDQPLAVRFRIQNGGNPSHDSGALRLVEQPWSEHEVTYNQRPQLGRVVGRLGVVASREVIERPLDVDLTGKSELSLAIDPTSTDGVDFLARESGHGAELIVEYQLP